MLGGNSGCTNADAKYNSLPSYSTFVNDTFVFLAITYRLAADAALAEGSWRSRLLAVIKGKGLHRLSRSLMKSGQLYYL